MATWSDRLTEAERQKLKQQYDDANDALLKALDTINKYQNENFNLKLRITELEKQLAWPKVTPPKAKLNGKPQAPTSRIASKEEFDEAMRRWCRGY